MSKRSYKFDCEICAFATNDTVVFDRHMKNHEEPPNTESDKSIDEILNIKLEDAGVKVYKLIDINAAKDQLFALLMDVIGADDTENGHSKVNGSNPVLYFGHRNELRAEQRIRLIKLFNKEISK